jgi:DNA primase
VEEYRSRAQGAVPYLEFVLAAAIQKQGALDDPKKKVQVVNAILPYLAKLPNAVERSEYVSRFARKLGIEDQQLLAETKRAAQQKRVRLAEEPIASVASMKTAEKKLLQMLLGNVELQRQILPLCTKQDFEGLASEKIFSILIDGFGRNQPVTYESLHRQFAGEAEQALLAHMEIEEMPETPSKETAESFFNALRIKRLTANLQKIQMEIADAANSRDDAMLNQLLEQRARVDREMISLSRK